MQVVVEHDVRVREVQPEREVLELRERAQGVPERDLEGTNGQRQNARISGNMLREKKGSDNTVHRNERTTLEREREREREREITARASTLRNTSGTGECTTHDALSS